MTYSVFALAAFTACLGLWMLRSLIVGESLRLPDVVAGSCLTYYGVGTCIGYLSLEGSSIDDMLRDYRIGHSDVATALLLCLLFAALTLSIGLAFKKNTSIQKHLIRSAADQSSRGAVYWALAAFVLVAQAYLLY